ncbi:YdcF family protein [Rhodobacterales bacterium LSUCC0031]|nr:YdcF family protein [Rhodobacterales bacterium LSUCC0031]
MRWLGRFIRAGLWLWAVSFLAVLAWTFLWPMERPLPRGDAIICLGAAVDQAGRIDQASRRRAEACAELARAGAAPIVVFSGGPRQPGLPTAAAGMSEAAEATGMGGALVLREGASYSTLHNALFSLELVAPSARLILVTEAFHLPRAWASFRAMGARDLALVPSERLRRDARGYAWHMLLRESLAIWFNLARYGAWRIGGAVGIDPATRVAWLH